MPKPPHKQRNDSFHQPAYGQNPWQVQKRSNGINWRVLLIACGVTLGLVAVAGIAVALINVDYSRISLAAFQPAEDSHEKLYADWQKLDQRQAKLLGSIDHKSDCLSMNGPYEGMILDHQLLLFRAVKLNGFFNGEAIAFADLPPFPVERNTRRQIEPLLTPQFRELESRLNTISEAVLQYMNYISRADRPTLDALSRESANEIDVRLKVLRLLAQLDPRARQTTADAVAVEIYGIASQRTGAVASSSPASAVAAGTTAVEPLADDSAPGEFSVGDSSGSEDHSRIQALLDVLDNMRRTLGHSISTSNGFGLSKALEQLESAL